MPNLPIPPSLKSRIPELQVTVATKMGLTGPMAREVQREVLWWIFPRVHAAKNVRGLYSGLGVGWTSTGYAELLPVEVPRPGRGRVAVLTEVSVISPGTERARYLRLPNASFGLGMPGYSSAGEVIAVGRGVDGIGVGDRVAVDGGRHQSITTAHMSNVYKIPAGVSTADAALIKLAVIAGNGVWRSRLQRGEEVVVIGAGLIGILAQRLAAAAGADPVAAIARSTARESLAVSGGTRRFLVADADREEIEALGAPVVIDATGDPQTINLAVGAAGTGGRIIVLGSPRGITNSFPLDEIRAKRLEVIGVHEDNQLTEQERTGIDVERDRGDFFMRELAGGRLSVSDLMGPVLDPREPGLIYRELSKNPPMMGAYFDWSAIHRKDRMRRGHLLRVPSLAGKGMDMEKRPVRRTRTRTLAQQAGLDDPFRGATGMMRIGMLGCGDIATDNAAAAAHAPNVEMVACYDPVSQLANDIAARCGATVSPSAAALVEHPEVDSVLLSVPHHLHAPLALQAIAAGKHVIVEKPQANTLHSAVAMADAAERAGVVLSIAFPYRYQPKVLLARQLVLSGAVGEVGGCFMRALLDKTPAYWVGGYSGRSPSDWRRSREKAGGGILMMNLTHYIDLFRHLTGLETDEVWSHHETTDEPMDIEDSISVAARFSNGALGSVVGGSAARGALNEEFRLWGHDGHIAVEPDARVFTLRAIEGFRTARWQRFGNSGGANMRALYLSRLATAIHEGRQPEVTADDGLAVQAFVEAAYRSGDTGQGVRLTEVLEEARSAAVAGATS